MYNHVNQLNVGKKGKTTRKKNDLHCDTNVMLQAAEKSMAEEQKRRSSVAIETVEKLMTKRDKAEHEIAEIEEEIDVQELELRDLKKELKRQKRKEVADSYGKITEINGKIIQTKANITMLKKKRERKIELMRTLDDSVK